MSIGVVQGSSPSAGLGNDSASRNDGVCDQFEKDMHGTDAKTRISRTKCGHESANALGAGEKAVKDSTRSEESIIAEPAWPLKKLAATIGLLNSVNRAMKTRHLMTRSLYADVRIALNSNPVWDNRLIPISSEATEELQRWLASAHLFNGRQIHPHHRQWKCRQMHRQPDGEPYAKEEWSPACGRKWRPS